MLQRRSVIVRSSVAPSGPVVAPGGALGRTRTIERILRYPSGEERRIVYPVVESASNLEEEETLVEEEPGPWWAGSTWLAKPAAVAPAAAVTALPVVQRPPSPRPVKQDDVLTFNWADIKAQAAALSEAVKCTYQVLFGCPWPFPRPMFVLTLSQDQGASHAFYTLPTRVTKKQDFTDELAMVLGSSVMASKFSASDLEDGVVAFSSRAQAEKYVQDMIAEDTGVFVEVHVCEVTSHELFRLVGEAKGCVVAVGFQPESQAADTATADAVGTQQAGEVWIPAPHQLATSLRGKSGWD